MVEQYQKQREIVAQEHEGRTSKVKYCEAGVWRFQPEMYLGTLRKRDKGRSQWVKKKLAELKERYEYTGDDPGVCMELRMKGKTLIES